MSKKKDELNLKGPDALQVRAAESAEYLKANAKLVTGVVAALLLVTLGYLAYDYLAGERLKERQIAVTEIDQIYAEEAKKHGELRGELEKELDALKLQDKDKDKSTPELKAKIKTLQAQLDAKSEVDHSKSMAGYRKVFEDYKSTPQGNLAGVRYASVLAKQEKLAEAKSVLSEVTKTSKGLPILRTQAGMVLISILEDLAEYDQALAEAEALLAVVGKDMKARVLLAKGRILYLKKDAEGAKQALNEILSSHEGSQEAEKARGYMALLNQSS